MEELGKQFELVLQNPVIFTLFIIWLMVWKGLSLWQSANRKQLVWFILLLIFNTLGILEILYLLYLHKWSLDNGKLLNLLSKYFHKTKTIEGKKELSK